MKTLTTSFVLFLFLLGYLKNLKAFFDPKTQTSTLEFGLQFLNENVLKDVANYLIIIHSYSHLNNSRFNKRIQVRCIILNDNYTLNRDNNFVLKSDGFRFTMPITIAIGPISRSVVATSLLRYISLDPSNLIVFTVDGKYRRSDVDLSVTYLPALKIVFHRNLSLVNMTFIQSSSKLERYLSASFNLNLLVSPLKCHKHMYWNSNQGNVDALVFMPPHTKPFGPIIRSIDACQQLLRNRSLDILKCNYGLMTVSYLAQVHNISIKIYDKDIEDDQMTKGMKSPFLVYSEFIPNPDDVPTFQKTGLRFAHIFNFNIIYCKKPSSYNQSNCIFCYTTLWLRPFSRGTWAMLVSGFIFTSWLLFQAQQETYSRRKMFQYFLLQIIIILGKSVKLVTLKKVKLILMCIYLLSFLLGSIYSNSIISLVVVPQIPNIYGSLKQMLFANYKIYYFTLNIQENVSPKTIFNYTFQMRGIPQFLNSFHVIKSNPYLYFTIETMTEFVSEKVMFFWPGLDSSRLNRWL